MNKADNIGLWNRRFSDRKASGLKVEDWCCGLSKTNK